MNPLAINWAKITREASVVGLSTITTAYLLQKLYKTTGFYPPNLIFYFFIGFNAHILWELLGGNKWYCQNACIL